MGKRLKPAASPLPGRSQGERIQSADTWRAPAMSSSTRGYDYQWRKGRAEHLAANPFCVRCRAAGLIVAATVVDHVTPHNGNAVLFWDRNNWQSLCATCHSSAKQREEIAERYQRTNRAPISAGQDGVGACATLPPHGVGWVESSGSD